VGWIPGLTDVTAATGLLFSLYAYLRFRNGGRARWWWAALCAYAVALCTKEAAITLPGVIGIYEVMRAWNGRRIFAANVIGPAAFGGVMVAYLLFRRWWMGAFLGGYGTGVHSDFSWGRLHTVLVPNLSNAFFPLPGLAPGMAAWALAAFFLAVAAGLIFAHRRGRAIAPAIAAGAGAIILFLPGINLPTGYIMEGQRFAYVPSAMAIVAVVYTLAGVIAGVRRFLAVAAVLVVASAISLGTFNYNWYRAGKVSKKIMAGMAELPHARKIYVLATTDNYNEAFIMPHSLALAGMALLDDSPSKEMPVAVAVNYWQSDYKVRATPAERNGNAGWLVSLHQRKEGKDAPAAAANNSRTAPSLEPLFPAPADWAEIRPEPGGVFVRLAGFDPAQDKIVYLDGAKWHVL
jgi:hypothetical protein